VAVGGRAALLAQQRQLEAGRKDRQQDDGPDERQFGQTAAAAGSHELGDQQIGKQARQRGHDEQQANRVHGLLLSQQGHRFRRKQAAQPRMSRHIVLSQRQHRSLRQRVEPDARDGQRRQQQTLEVVAVTRAAMGVRRARCGCRWGHRHVRHGAIISQGPCHFHSQAL